MTKLNGQQVLQDVTCLCKLLLSNQLNQIVWSFIEEVLSKVVTTDLQTWTFFFFFCLQNLEMLMEEKKKKTERESNNDSSLACYYRHLKEMILFAKSSRLWSLNHNSR